MNGIRITGALLMCFGGFAAGYFHKRELERSAQLLQSFWLSLGLMEKELLSLKTPLEPLFERLSGCIDEKAVRDFYSSLYKNMGQERFSRQWRCACETLPLSAEANYIIIPLGESLGRYSPESQATEIALCRERLSALIQSKREELNIKGKTYPKLGLALGAICAILLL